MLQLLAGTNRSGSCDPREQGTALVALGLALLLAVGTVIAAVLAGGEEGSVLDPQRSSMAGLGGGTGGGIGSGVGAGGGATGDGPGAGRVGLGKGASGSDASSMPKGAETGAVAGGPVTPSESLVAGPVREAPKWGFTLPDKDQPPDPPTGASAVGVRNGTGGEGRAGAGGGGRTEFMGVKVDAKSVVYILDFSASMRDDDGRLEVLRKELARSIGGLAADTKFQVVLYGKSQFSGARVARKRDGGEAWTNAIPMPPEGSWLVATPANRAKALAWVGGHEPDPQSGSGTWDSMRLALEMKPEAIFLLTDGEFGAGDVTDLVSEISFGNADGTTQINTIAFASEGDVMSLQQIAAQNHGNYRRISLKPQPAP